MVQPPMPDIMQDLGWFATPEMLPQGPIEVDGVMPTKGMVGQNALTKERQEAVRKAHESGDSDLEVEGVDSDDEHLEDYEIDGYHPVHVNEILDNKYIVLQKLGWGHFSTVWLALKLQDKKLYALKI